MDDSRETILQAAGLQVRFFQIGDRYAHAIELVRNGGRLPLLESIEGSPEEPWPPSPPLQELHVERRGPAGRVALLVGMAGGSHWSLSVEVDSHVPCISFDVACRTHAPAGPLASTYRPLVEFAPNESQTEATCLIDKLAWRLCGQEPDLGPSAEMHLIADRLLLAPAPQPGAGKQTLRWRYRFEQVKPAS